MQNKKITKLKKMYARLNKEFGVSRIGVFGSYARGEEKQKSDIDLLVEFNRPVNLFEFSRLKSFLTDQLGTAVDLVTPNALKSAIKKNVLENVIYV